MAVRAYVPAVLTMALTFGLLHVADGVRASVYTAGLFDPLR